MKFSDDGSEISIAVKKETHDNHAEFRITDHGIGMPQETMDRIFDRF